MPQVSSGNILKAGLNTPRAEAAEPGTWADEHSWKQTCIDAEDKGCHDSLGSSLKYSAADRREGKDIIKMFIMVIHQN